MRPLVDVFPPKIRQLFKTFQVGVSRFVTNLTSEMTSYKHTASECAVADVSFTGSSSRPLLQTWNGFCLLLTHFFDFISDELYGSADDDLNTVLADHMNPRHPCRFDLVFVYSIHVFYFNP